MKFVADKAYLLPEKPLPFDKLGLPPVARSFFAPAWWRLRVLEWFAHENRMYVDVISYHSGEVEFTPEQEALFKELEQVESISFRSISTQGLMTTLRGTRPVTILPQLSDPGYMGAYEALFGEEEEAEPDATEMATPAEEPPQKPLQVPVPPVTRVVKQSFQVPLKEVRFQLGSVSVVRYFREVDLTIELQIPNPELREEFDAVKNYFANVLKTKKIQVFAEIQITRGEITGAHARSPEIAKIDKSLIENVKFEFVQDTVKKRMAFEVDKSLFTMDELFESATDGRVKGGAFYQSERELFEDLLQITDTKHYRNLRYLSSVHAHHIMKLRFVHRPLSFIFLIEGKHHYHLIWETLDTTEATYIWHSTRDLKELRKTLEKIEDILNVIKVQGKIAYLNTRQEAFRRICHDYSNLSDGFIKWKNELESMLT
ncbi:MAG TPA: hypothetical protein P5228_09960 [Bacteroidales bacterium]|nr:hypothetical protein [Bacteroidales bacterium]